MADIVRLSISVLFQEVQFHCALRSATEATFRLSTTKFYFFIMNSHVTFHIMLSFAFVSQNSQVKGLSFMCLYLMWFDKDEGVGHIMSHCGHL